jgi:hypothetical protein
METRNGGNVPGVTGQGACAETACVIGKIGNDYFNDLLGKPDCRGQAHHRDLWRNTLGMHPPNSGLSLVPNPLD